MLSSRAIQEAAEFCCKRISRNFVLRGQQLQALTAIFQGKDCLCLLPTGFGKTVIFNLIPAVCEYLRSNVDGCDSLLPEKAVVVVVSPLKALILDHVRSAKEKKGLDLRPIEITPAKYNEILSLHFNLLFGIPEVWLEKKWRELLASKGISENVVAIVVDEVHLVKWGATSKKAGAFRESFGRIHELRSIGRQNIPILALTATADADYQSLISASISLSKHVVVVSACADRKNIRLSVVRVPSKSIKCLTWITERLKASGRMCPKIIIYCRSIKMVGWLYEQLCFALGDARFVSSQSGHGSECIIGMYHSETSARSKSRVLHSLTVDGPVRLVLATSSLGCGIDCRDVSHVVHYGPAIDLADYVQQIGRAGRNTPIQCHAVLYLYPGVRTKEISQKMAAFISRCSKECLRLMLYSPFSFDTEPVQSMLPGHMCCSFCYQSCVCGTTSCLAVFDYEVVPVVSDELQHGLFVRCVSEEDKRLVKTLLEEYVSVVCSQSEFLFTPCSSVSGLSPGVIEEVLNNLSHIDSVDYVLKCLHVNDRSLAQEIVLICHEVFDDFELIDVDLTAEYAQAFDEMSQGIV